MSAVKFFIGYQASVTMTEHHIGHRKGEKVKPAK